MSIYTESVFMYVVYRCVKFLYKKVKKNSVSMFLFWGGMVFYKVNINQSNMQEMSRKGKEYDHDQ